MPLDENCGSGEYWLKMDDDDWDWPPTIYGTGQASALQSSRSRIAQRPLGLLAAARRSNVPNKKKKAAGKQKAKAKVEQKNAAAQKKQKKGGKGAR